MKFSGDNALRYGAAALALFVNRDVDVLEWVVPVLLGGGDRGEDGTDQGKGVHLMFVRVR